MNIVLMLLLLFSSCEGQKDKKNTELNFEIQLLLKDLKYSVEQQKYIELVFGLMSGDYDESNPLYKAFNKEDYSLCILQIQGQEILSLITTDFKKYFTNSYELLAFTTYLNTKYNVTKELYDNLLRSCLFIDKKNYAALYLLAKFRYENGLIEDAQCLIYYLDNFTNSKHVSSLKKNIFKIHGKLDGQIPPYEDFINEEISYRLIY